MLRAENLEFNYQRPIIKDISLQLSPGELLVVIGPNGAGKSTLARLLCGLLLPARGKVLIGDSALSALPRRERAQRLAYVAQETRLQFPITAFEYVLQGRFAYGRGIGFEQENDLKAARNAMNLTDTIDFIDRPINALSGGERQRVFLARALAQEAQFLILDEPTSNLDISHQVDTLRLLHRLARERALGVLLITHELNLAAEFADRALLLKDGCAVHCGPPVEVFQREMLEKVFETELIVDNNPASGAPRVTISANMRRLTPN
jgi:iron complex transport system ATP-binding protein